MDGVASIAANHSSSGESKITQEQDYLVLQLETVVYTNIATCQLRLLNPIKALDNANKAINLSPNNWKSHLRKGT